MPGFSEEETPSDEKATGNREMREHRTTALSEQDSRALLEALDDPPSPTRAARDAVRGCRSRLVNAGNAGVLPPDIDHLQ